MLVKTHHSDNLSAHLPAIFVAIVLLTLAAAWGLTELHQAWASAAPSDPSVLLEKFRRLLKPKPTERFVFLTLVLIVPAFAFATGLWHFRRDALPLPLKNYASLLVVLSAILIYLPLAGFQTSFSGASRFSAYRYLSLLVLVASLALAAAWYSTRIHQRHEKATSRKRHGVLPSVSPEVFRAMCWALLTVLVLLQISAWRLLGAHSLSQSGAWHDSADAMFYSISQLATGRDLLADLPAQYGLYALLMQPVFELIGLSVLKFTAVCAALQVLSIAAVYVVIQRSVRDKTMLAGYTLSLVTITFGTLLWLIGLDEPYFQYWPLRFFWPAISLLAVHQYCRSPTLFRSFAVSVFGSVATLWNFDSGVVVAIAFAGLLTAKWLVLFVATRSNTASARHHLMKALGLHMATFLVVVCLAFAWLSLKAQVPLNWEWLFGYQKAFYSLGFNMLPLPLPLFPWMSILGVYLMGILIATQLWRQNPQSRSAGTLLYLALLGLGLFVYYQGRSHPLNLISVSWPAITLMVILCDRVLRGIKAGLLSRVHVVFPVAALSVLALFSAALLIGIPRLVEESATAWKNLEQPSDRIVSEELQFIRKNSQRGDTCAILSLRQGLYLGEAGLSSPLIGAGYAEMLLVKDRDQLLSQLETLPMRCVFVGIGKSSALDTGVDLMSILQKRYDVVRRIEGGSMLLMHPKIH